jgi:hypothetical protein
MHITESKTLLAKLMATENLIVEQRKVNTASFDVKSRVLTLPILDSKISPFLYDLFLGHEVGHALHTPLEGLMKAKEEGISRSVVNVVEDSRIERKIKNKYPGIRTSFVKGYRELIEKDFFGTKGADLNDLNFIDRVNLYTKGGAAQGIQFNEFEKALVNKIETTETYDDVMRVSREVMAYMKEEAETAKKLNPTEEFEEDEDGDYEGFDSEGYEDSDDHDDETETRISKGADETERERETDKPVDSGNSFGGGTDPEGESDEQIKSHTDETYRKNESKLFNADGDSYYYGNIPDIDLEKAIVPYKQLWAEYRKESIDFQERNKNYWDIKNGVSVEKFQKIRNDAKKVVGYLAKEFELRKNADQLKRASVAKTGELNMSKIYSYKFAEDLFKKITVLPNGKSHGLVMFLDWSGSMSDHIENTFKQLFNLVMFCKKVNIPYEVYAFTSEHDRPYSNEFKEGDIVLRNFKLMNFLSSKMSASEFTYACSALVQACEYRGWKPNWMQKGGTPLSEAVISAMKIVPEFQKQYKLQVVNTVFLTDGDGHSCNEVYYYTNPDGYKTSGKGIGYDYGKWKKLVIRDPKTRSEVIVDHPQGRELTSGYIKMLKLRTQCNIVGFYVLNGRELSRELYHFLPRSVTNYDKYKYEFRKNKYMVVTSAGYDEYYLLRTESLDTDDEVTFEVKENATTRGLVSAFSKYAGNRLNNRVVLNRFIGMIA